MKYVAGKYGHYCPEERISIEDGHNSAEHYRTMALRRGFAEPRPQGGGSDPSEPPEVPDHVYEEVQAKIDEHYAQLVEGFGEPE